MYFFLIVHEGGSYKIHGSTMAEIENEYTERVLQRRSHVFRIDGTDSVLQLVDEGRWTLVGCKPN